MWDNRSSLFGKFHITVWNFPNDELQETHFHAVYPNTSLLAWQIVLNDIMLFISLGCFIVLYYREIEKESFKNLPQVTPCLNRWNTIDCTCSFNNSLNTATKNASKFFCVLLSLGTNSNIKCISVNIKWYGVKGSLHTTIFSKYTELLRLKPIFRIFWYYFGNIWETNVFQSKNVESVVIFKKWRKWLTANW